MVFQYFIFQCLAMVLLLYDDFFDLMLFFDVNKIKESYKNTPISWIGLQLFYFVLCTLIGYDWQPLIIPWDYIDTDSLGGQDIKAWKNITWKNTIE